MSYDNNVNEAQSNQSINPNYNKRISYLDQLNNDRINTKRRLDEIDQQIELINKNPIIEEFLNITRSHY